MLNLLNKVVMFDSIRKIDDSEYIYVTEDSSKKSTLIDIDDVDVSEDTLDNLRSNNESYSAIMSLENNKIHAEILTAWF